MLVEIRIGGETGAQTVFPGSVHETGEHIEWSESGEPAKIENAELLAGVSMLASVCLLARHWPGEGSRHDAALTLGGFLSRVGYQPAQIRDFVEAIARAAGDPEHRDRKWAAEDAANAYRQGKHAYGLRKLKEVFNEPVATQVAAWLNYSAANSETGGEDGLAKRTPSSNDIITEQSTALQFAEKYGDELRYCRSTRQWFRWNGVIWVRDELGCAYHCAGQLSSRMGEDQNAATRKNLGRAAFANGVEKFAQHNPKLVMTADDWDRDPMLLGTPGGTVDLQTGELRESRREDGITKTTSVAPLDEPCPRWLQFLNEATGNDADLIQFLQQWCGYGLTGLTREHALVFVYGSGGNGKTVFLNVVQTIMNDYAVTAAMDTFTASNRDKHPTDLAMLRGARLVTASETEEGRPWAETRIKQMTGGDPITAHFMKQDNFTYRPQFKLTIVGNHKPVLRNLDEAARRRFLIVPFERKPERPDRELEQKLIAEAAGILRWMIAGCSDWLANGLVKPDVVLRATEDYFSDQDLFAQWLTEECDCQPGNNDLSEASSSLYKSWKEYAIAAGSTPGAQQSFRDLMEAHGFRFYRSNKAREFFGIRSRSKPTHWQYYE